MCVDAIGVITRLNNLISGLLGKLEKLEQKNEQINIQIQNTQEQLKKPFFKEQELKGKSKRLYELD